MLDTYWTSTDNCLKYMKTKVNTTNMVMCSKRGCMSKSRRSKTIYGQPVVFKDYRPCKFTRAELKKINRLGLPIRFTSWNHYSRVLYRIFANPNKELKDQIVRLTQDIPFKDVTTIHVRSGGYLANKQEGACWVSQQELPRLIKAVERIMNYYKLGRYVYLTTDSDKVDAYFRQHLKNVQFISINEYSRYHTTGNSSDEAFRAALFDLFVSAQGSSVLYTPRSGYSKAVTSLSRSGRQYQLPLHRRYLHK